MSVEYLDLADHLAIAQAVTNLDMQTVITITNVDLADSALHAPAAGFGDDDFYSDFVDKAAVLLVRLARNHPLPDGNKRAAWHTSPIHGAKTPDSPASQRGRRSYQTSSPARSEERTGRDSNPEPSDP